MNVKYRKFIQASMCLMLLVGLAYGLWYLVGAFVVAIGAASPEVTAAIVGAMATILVGVLVVVVSQAYERKRSSEEAHRLKKIAIYQDFVEMVSRLLASENKNLSLKSPSQKELVHYLYKYKSDILLWGSPEVIKAQMKFETISNKENEDNKIIFNSVNAIYLAIRKDIGLSNSGLNNLELVKLYLDQKARAELS